MSFAVNSDDQLQIDLAELLAQHIDRSSVRYLLMIPDYKQLYELSRKKCQQLNVRLESIQKKLEAFSHTDYYKFIQSGRSLPRLPKLAVHSGCISYTFNPACEQKSIKMYIKGEDKLDKTEEVEKRVESDRQSSIGSVGTGEIIVEKGFQSRKNKNLKTMDMDPNPKQGQWKRLGGDKSQRKGHYLYVQRTDKQTEVLEHPYKRKSISRTKSLRLVCTRGVLNDCCPEDKRLDNEESHNERLGNPGTLRKNTNKDSNGCEGKDLA